MIREEDKNDTIILELYIHITKRRLETLDYILENNSLDYFKKIFVEQFKFTVDKYF